MWTVWFFFFGGGGWTINFAHMYAKPGSLFLFTIHIVLRIVKHQQTFTIWCCPRSWDSTEERCQLALFLSHWVLPFIFSVQQSFDFRVILFTFKSIWLEKVFTVTGWHHWEARDARKGFDNGDREQLLLLTGDRWCPVSSVHPNSNSSTRLPATEGGRLQTRERRPAEESHWKLDEAMEA